MEALAQCIVGLLLVFIGTYILVTILMYYFKAEEEKELKRKKEISNYFINNGFEFNNSAIYFPDIAKNFKIAHTDKIGYWVNNYIAEIHGQKTGVDIVISDHQYIDGSGKNKGCCEHTLCLLKEQGLKIPDFYIRRRIFILDRIEKLFGMKEIVISEDKEFSKQFVLQGQNEEEIKEFFNSNIRQVFMLYCKKNCEYESNNNSLLVSKRKYFLFNTAGFLDVKERIELLDDSLNLFNNIKSSNQS